MRSWVRGTVALVVAAGVVGGCAMRQKKVEESLEDPAPIDCSTAPGDIRSLQHEKAHVAERIAEGVTAIYPVGLVVGLLTGTEGTKVKVAIGEYDKAIDKRIAQIKETCDVDDEDLE